MRVNLVIACWGGKRRTVHPEYESDRSYYLKLQVDSLSRFRHHLDQVTFVSNGGESEYLQYLDTLEYKVIQRENLGMSYGAFDAAWHQFPDFDYYIFLEDDYLFVRDNFDKIMVEIFESVPGCGYLCQLAWGMVTPYPSIFNGIASRECLRRLDILPGANAHNSNEILYYGQAETYGQHSWGTAVQSVGLKLCDMGDRFKAPYIGNANEYLCWYPKAAEYLIVPAQIYHRVLENPNYVLEYQTTDEDWEKFRTYYYSLRNVYLSSDNRKSLEIVAAPFKIRTREDCARIAHIYDKSMGR